MPKARLTTLAATITLSLSLTLGTPSTTHAAEPKAKPRAKSNTTTPTPKNNKNSPTTDDDEYKDELVPYTVAELHQRLIGFVKVNTAKDPTSLPQNKIFPALLVTEFLQGHIRAARHAYSMRDETSNLSQRSPGHAMPHAVIPLIEFIEERMTQLPPDESCDAVISAWYILTHDQATPLQKAQGESALVYLRRNATDWEAPSEVKKQDMHTLIEWLRLTVEEETLKEEEIDQRKAKRAQREKDQ